MPEKMALKGGIVRFLVVFQDLLEPLPPAAQHRTKCHVQHFPRIEILQQSDQVAIRQGRGEWDALNLRRPIYKATAAFGHFGRRLPEFTWEQTDRADALAKAAGVEVAAPVGR